MTSSGRHANMKQWAIGCRISLLHVHTNNHGDRASYEAACMALSEVTEFIVEYHGRETAAATLHSIAMATEAKLPLPNFTPIGAPVLAPVPPTRAMDRLVGATAARLLRQTWTVVFLALATAALALFTLRHFFP